MYIYFVYNKRKQHKIYSMTIIMAIEIYHYIEEIAKLLL